MKTNKETKPLTDEEIRTNDYRKIEKLLLDRIKKSIYPQFEYTEAMDAVMTLHRLNEAYKNGK